MDVRCPRCKAEYELADGRLRAGGITVQCAGCEHVFRVRKPGDTTANTPTDQDEDSEERFWLVRLQDGEIKVCREFGTFQRWIVSGIVSQDCEISHTGKIWKPLRELKELNSLFAIARDAQELATKRAGVVDTMKQNGSSDVESAPTLHGDVALASATSVHSAELVPATLAGDGDGIVGDRALGDEVSEHLQAAEGTLSTSVASASGITLPPPFENEQKAEVPQVETYAANADLLRDDNPSTVQRESLGSTAVPLATPQFLDSSQYGISTVLLSKSSPTSLPPDDPENEHDNRKNRGTGDMEARDSRSRVRSAEPGVGRWIVIASLVVLAGGALAIYRVFSYEKSPKMIVAEHARIDAGAETDPLTDAVVSRSWLDSPIRATLETALDRHDRIELEGLLTSLMDVGDSTAVARARLHNALAQCDLDDGLLAPKRLPTLQKSSKAKASLALGLVRKALNEESNDSVASIAYADAIRLLGMPTRSVERALRKISGKSPNNSNASYVSAMLRLRDRRIHDARSILEEINASSVALRVAYRLAMIDFSEKKIADARARLETMLTQDPEHRAANQLLAFLDSNFVGTTSGVKSLSNTGNTSSSSNQERSGGEYGRLLERADLESESGSCNKAVNLYKQALVLNPTGVASLTGLGYCAIESGDYSDALSQFRAALTISPSYQDALWGLAEGYQAQEANESALAAYREFISKHPSSRRAEMAKRQIRRFESKLDSVSDEER